MHQVSEIPSDRSTDLDSPKCNRMACINIGFTSVRDCRIWPATHIFISFFKNKGQLLSDTLTMRYLYGDSFQSSWSWQSMSCHMKYTQGFLSQLCNKRTPNLVAGFPWNSTYKLTGSTPARRIKPSRCSITTFYWQGKSVSLWCTDWERKQSIPNSLFQTCILTHLKQTISIYWHYY